MGRNNLLTDIEFLHRLALTIRVFITAECEIMRGRCVFTVGGNVLFGNVVVDSGGVRFRVWSPEWATLGLEEGQVVRFGLPGHGEEDLLISSVRPIEGDNTWVCLAVPIKAAVPQRVAAVA